MIDPRRYARHGCCHVLELRQYLLQPGGTEILVDLFDRHFLEALEQTDMHEPGQFEDLDRRDRFVWLRGFRDMPSRRQALASFYYDGPAWQQHREKANAAMIDSDNVLLLRPVYFGSTYPVKAAPRPPVQPGRVGAMLEVEVQHLEDTQVTAPTTVVDLAEKVIAAARRTGAEVLLVAATHEEPNDFPALPVRDERAVVWLACYPDAESRERTRAELGREDDAEHVRLRAVGRSQIR